MKFSVWVIIAILLGAFGVWANETILDSETYVIPGVEGPVKILSYRNPDATNVTISGTWGNWTNRENLVKQNGIWIADIAALRLPHGRYEYKFIADKMWESGDNRVFHVNAEHLLECPPDIVRQALIETPYSIVVYLASPIPKDTQVIATITPTVEIESCRVEIPLASGNQQGYSIVGESVTFVFDPKVYNKKMPPQGQVSVAGNFNSWNAHDGRWELRDDDNDGIWTLPTQKQALRMPAGEENLIFKFVVNKQDWLNPPVHAPNATSDGKGNVNLRIDLDAQGATTLQITTKTPLSLSETYLLTLNGLWKKPLYASLSPGALMDTIVSDKPLGVAIDKERGTTTYRLFAPRAKSVHLCIFDQPEYIIYPPKDSTLPTKRIEPVERYPMWRDPADSVWEITLLGVDTGKYYAFNVAGPTGTGEGFDPLAAIGDPYAVAAAHAENCGIVIDREATNRWFQGWTDQDWKTPPPQDVVIYEAHVRDLTKHPSSGVDPALRGSYLGLLASADTDAGLAALKDLGVNTLELLPINEFSNGPTNHNWGYCTVFYFAPEASYAQEPLKGSQYYEFKHLVNELHNLGFSVIMDVVYNHVGSPNVFHQIDKKYYFRLNQDYTYCNFSGCGNDIRTEAPMMRRLIVDNIVYWMKEFHVDGFRFDLAELIDMETMLAIRDAARAINPNALLISEPWSFRGENKHELTDTGWSAWNNDYRYAAKNFLMGHQNRDQLKNDIFGSLDTWAADPLQPVNYLESHDDMALVDELSTHPGHDGSKPTSEDLRLNRLGTTLLLTSLGIPMIAEGQEFLRSKFGISNTYNKGDLVNALRWDERELPPAKAALDYYRGLIHLRNSPQGAAFRLAKRPSPTYYRWLKPRKSEHALGYGVNLKHSQPGAAFIVLLNADSKPVDFRFTIPEGNWRMISDGKVVDPTGLPKTITLEGPRKTNLRIPSVGSAILMDGF